jgi:uncharacterized protein YjbJ (UPF0337 family)
MPHLKGLVMNPFLRRIFYGINFTPFIQEAHHGKQGSSRRLAEGCPHAAAGSLTRSAEPEEGDMALNERSRRRARNKTRNKAQELKGQIKEATGRATGNPRLKAKGRADQTRANLKQAVEKVKDALRPKR